MDHSIRHQDTREWIAELEALEALYDVKEIRCTPMTERNQFVAALTILAGFVAGGVLVELKKEVARVTLDHEWVAAEAKYLVEKMLIQEAAHRLGIKVKSGWYTPTGANTGEFR